MDMVVQDTEHLFSGFCFTLVLHYSPHFLINTFSADFKLPVTETKWVNFLQSLNEHGKHF